MEQDTIIEGNKKIAEFLQIPICDRCEKYCGHYKIGVVYYAPCDMMYHNSFDWLIPVIDDIYYSRRFNTGVQSTEISSMAVKAYSNIKSSLLNLSITQTWHSVITFIDWFNTQTK